MGKMTYHHVPRWAWTRPMLCRIAQDTAAVNCTLSLRLQNYSLGSNMNRPPRYSTTYYLTNLLGRSIETSLTRVVASLVMPPAWLRNASLASSPRRLNGIFCGSLENIETVACEGSDRTYVRCTVSGARRHAMLWLNPVEINATIWLPSRSGTQSCWDHNTCGD